MRNFLLFNLAIILCLLTGISANAQDDYTGDIDGSFSYSGSRSGDMLYDQISGAGTAWIISAEYTNSADKIETSFSAEDFIVPEGETWNIAHVSVLGSYADAPSVTSDTVNVFIYNDDENTPGTELYTFENVTTFNEIVVNEDALVHELEITLPSTVSLTEGKYWICVQPKVDKSVSGRWGWIIHSGQTYNTEFYWKNPLGGFSGGHTDWTNATEVLWWPPYNLSFALYGEGHIKDMAVMDVLTETAPEMTSTEAITVSLKNEGTEPQSGFNISYSINGDTPVVENIGTSLIGPNSYFEYTFNTTADLSVAGPYEITIITSLPGDEDTSNDTIVKTIYNLGEIYEMEESNTITTCSGTFVDLGGYTGGLDMGNAGVTTLLPESENDRVRLTFLEFDPGYCNFSIYDGETTDAPLIGTWTNTDSPGEITALNPTGALTVEYSYTWDSGFGWVAFISCFSPSEDDFAVTELSYDIPSIFTGNEVTITANVLNYGTLTQAKDVSFTANGSVIGTVNTGDLISTADTVLTMVWAPTEAGDYTLEVYVEEDAGVDDNNSMSTEAVVYAFDTFYEGFELEAFPPEEWAQTNGYWSPNTSAFAGEKSAKAYIPSLILRDTLVTPLLNIEEDGVLTFTAYSSPWWPGKLQLLWKDGATGEWNFIQEMEMVSGVFTTFDVDVSVAAGTNSFGFAAYYDNAMAWGGEVKLDEVIGTNITRHFENNDLKTRGLTGTQFINAFEELNYQFKVKNNGLEAQPANSYTVKLWQQTDAGDVELSAIPGQYINSMQVLTYDVPVEFAEIGLVKVYATIEFAADENTENNTSNTFESIVLPGGSEIVDVLGEQSYGYANTSPVNFYYKNSLTENIYTAEEVDKEGLITGICYDYDFKEDISDAPVKIWIGQTDSTSFELPGYSSYFIPSTELTLVYEGNLDYVAGIHSNFIQLETPYLYDNSNNLVIMTEKLNDSTFEWNNRFSTHYSGKTTEAWTSNTEIPDPENPVPGAASTLAPDIHFIFNNDVTSMNGMITDEEGNAIEGATVLVDGLLLETTTNAAGFYEFDQIPAATYTITTSAFGFYDQSQEVNVYVGSVSSLDFTMEAIPTYSINALVVGSNDETVGLQGGTVKLNGYDSFETFTNPTGSFAIDGIYNLGTYTLEIWVPGYEVYTTQLEVTENTDLGTIVLTELYITAFNAVGTEVEDYVSIVWNTPNQLAEDVMIDDDGEKENGYAADSFEEVSLGNLFQLDQLATITSVQVYWAAYQTENEGPVSLDIYDAETETLLASSAEFLTLLDEWITVDVPNLTLENDFYVMVHWPGLEDITSFLGTDFSEGNPNTAYYYYPDSYFSKFENMIDYPCTFMIRPNIMTEATRGGDRSALSYNVYKGMADDVAGVAGWDKINNFPVTETSFNDTEWPPVYTDDYMYAVEAIYTEGNSEVVFSTPVHYQEPILPVENLVATDSIGYTIGWALIEWDAPQGANPIAYNIYLNNNQNPEATVTGTSYTFHDLPAESYAVGVSAVYNSGESAAEVVSFTITIDVEGMNADDISVFPNPATDYVVLDLEGSAKVEIFNTVGAIVKSIESYNGGNEINIESLEAGAYFFRLTNNENTSIQKVIVK